MTQLEQYTGPYQQLVMQLLDALNDFNFPLAQQRLAKLKQSLSDGAEL